VSRLILVRHGVTAWNQAGRYQGHQDIPLGELGRLQATRVAARLASESIDVCLTSDLGRARDTAAAILAGRSLTPTETPALRELGFGAWEGLGSTQIAPKFPAEWDAWIRDPVTAAPPEGETLQELLDRLLVPLAEVVALPTRQGEPHDWFAYRAAGGAEESHAGTVLVVSHGGPIRILIAHLLGLPLRGYWQFAIRPASVSILELYPEGAIAEVIGDTSHLLGLTEAPTPDPEPAPDPPVPGG
jgi:broad specificity phosphatase PhoE